MKGCEGCKLRELYPSNTFVSPKLPDPSRDLVRILVGEAPGELESQMGEAFVGASGKMLNNMLGKAGIDRNGLTVTNVLCCRPPNNIFPVSPEAKQYISRDDGQRAVRHCVKNHLLPLLKSRAWDKVYLIGGMALRFVANKTEGISKWRGSPLTIDTDEIE